jgi:hypothetical protein
MAEPKCPECSTGGKRHIVAEESDLASKDGDPWFEIVYCIAMRKNFLRVRKFLSSQSRKFFCACLTCC